MSRMGYAVLKTATPELWLDDGYALVQSDGYMHKVCGLTQVDSIAQSGTGVITLQLARLVNVVAVHPNVVALAGSDVAIHLVSVSVAGVNNSGNASVQIVLQAVTASTGAAVSLGIGTGLCVDIRYSDSALLIGSSPQAGMCVL